MDEEAKSYSEQYAHFIEEKFDSQTSVQHRSAVKTKNFNETPKSTNTSDLKRRMTLKSNVSTFNEEDKNQDYQRNTQFDM